MYVPQLLYFFVLFVLLLVGPELRHWQRRYKFYRELWQLQTENLRLTQEALRLSRETYNELLAHLAGKDQNQQEKERACPSPLTVPPTKS